MITIITPDAAADATEKTVNIFHQAGYNAALGRNADGYTTVAGYALGQTPPSDSVRLLLPDGVIACDEESAVLASRRFRARSSEVRVGSTTFGGANVSIIAGPCAVENVDAFRQTARGVVGAGVGVLRGGAYKPRTSPYSFRGHGRDAIRIMREIADELNVPVVTEVLSVEELGFVAEHCDMLQIGTRNMSNAYLIEAAAATGRPLLLKRGFASTVDELLFAAEGALASGARDVVLCERGIRSFDQATRNVLDVVTIADLASRTHLPIIADPSHATGRRDLVLPATLAALAAGADGVLVEVHHDPAEAMVDGPQSLTIEQYETLVARCNALLPALGRQPANGTSRKSDVWNVA